MRLPRRLTGVEIIYALALVFADLVMLRLAFVLAYRFRLFSDPRPGQSLDPPPTYDDLAALCVGVVLAAMGITSLAAVSASYEAEDQLRQRIRCITHERDYLCRNLRALGVYTTDGHANFVYLPAIGRPWREIFGDTGFKARYYSDGAARITVGGRGSTQAVLAAVAQRRVDQIAS